MNILLESRAFYPSVGGLEMMAQELGREWQGRGHDVRIVTVTPLDGETELEELDVLRSPSRMEWMRKMKWADVFFQNGVSLRSLLYPILTGCPIVFRHPSVIGSIRRDIRSELKRMATTLGVNVTSSQAVEEPVLGPTVRIPNTVRSIFYEQEMGEDWRDREGLLFVGRLVSMKGADVAIEATRLLTERGINMTLTICGDGPERPNLEKQAKESGIRERVSFYGWAEPEELACLYSKKKAFLFPTRDEGFGIVALEAIACGCPVVGSKVGGVPDAVGDCGILVPPGDATAHADAAEKVLKQKVWAELRSAMPDHKERHRIDRVAEMYLDVIKEVAHEA